MAPHGANALGQRAVIWRAFRAALARSLPQLSSPPQLSRVVRERGKPRRQSRTISAIRLSLGEQHYLLANPNIRPPSEFMDSTAAFAAPCVK